MKGHNFSELFDSTNTHTYMQALPLHMSSLLVSPGFRSGVCTLRPYVYVLINPMNTVIVVVVLYKSVVAWQFLCNALQAPVCEE